MVEGELVHPGTGKIEENKRDNGMTPSSCPLPMVSRLGRSEFSEKIHERFRDIPGTKDSIFSK